MPDALKFTVCQTKNTDRSAPGKILPGEPGRYRYSKDRLTRLFIEDIEKGIDVFDYNGPLVERTEYRTGLIRLATGDEPVTSHQQKIFT